MKCSFCEDYSITCPIALKSHMEEFRDKEWQGCAGTINKTAAYMANIGAFLLFSGICLAVAGFILFRTAPQLNPFAVKVLGLVGLATGLSYVPLVLCAILFMGAAERSVKNAILWEQNAIVSTLKKTDLIHNEEETFQINRKFVLTNSPGLEDTCLTKCMDRLTSS